MRKLRKQPTKIYNEWAFDFEAGDRCFKPDPNNRNAFIVDLRESTGRNKRDAGELTPVFVKKDGLIRKAILCDDGFWYWE